MNAPDLFGGEGRLPSAALRPVASPVRVSLFDAAAERRAIASGRPKSQERTELIAGPGLRCLRDHALVRDRKTRAVRCPECDG